MANLAKNGPRPLPWSAFKFFTHCYSRGYRAVQKIYGISEYQVYKRVMKVSKNWQRFKFCVKVMEIQLYLQGVQYELAIFSKTNDNASIRDIKKYLKRQTEMLDTCPRLSTLIQLPLFSRFHSEWYWDYLVNMIRERGSVVWEQLFPDRSDTELGIFTEDTQCIF